jgi:PAS domain S-box-containing protein
VRESEERFRLIANTAPVMIWMSGAEKQITYLNQTWLEYTGRPLDAVLGRRRAEILHPDDEERCLGVFEKPSRSVNLFRWSIGSAATTAYIAGW